jgi:hypothetical protein
VNACLACLARFSAIKNYFRKQHVCVKFCFKFGKTFSETFKVLKQAFGDEAMSRTQILERYKRSEEGRTSVEDSERSGRPSTSKNYENIQEVREMIPSNSRLTVREVAEEAGIANTTCHEILTENF